MTNRRDKLPTHKLQKELPYEIGLNFTRFDKSQVLVRKLFAGTCFYQATVVPR